MSSDFYEEGMNELDPQSDEERKFAEIWVNSEKLKDWLLGTREGKAINEEIKRRESAAIERFKSCQVDDIEGLQSARLELEVSKRVYEIFAAIFQDGKNAEAILTNEEE